MIPPAGSEALRVDVTYDEVLQRTGGRPVSSIVYDEATIAERVRELGDEITAASPTAICWFWAFSRAASSS